MFAGKAGPTSRNRLPLDGDASLIAAEMARVLKPPSPERTVVPAVVQIIEGMRSIHAWRADFDLAPPPPNNVDLLSRHFIEAMVKSYEHYTHKKPPASRLSDFAKLLAAIWKDLKFPVPDDEDLVGLLGSKLERAIHRSRKTKPAAQLR